MVVIAKPSQQLLSMVVYRASTFLVRVLNFNSKKVRKKSSNLNTEQIIVKENLSTSSFKACGKLEVFSSLPDICLIKVM